MLNITPLGARSQPVGIGRFPNTDINFWFRFSKPSILPSHHPPPALSLILSLPSSSLAVEWSLWCFWQLCVISKGWRFVIRLHFIISFSSMCTWYWRAHSPYGLRLRDAANGEVLLLLWAPFPCSQVRNLCCAGWRTEGVGLSEPGVQGPEWLLLFELQSGWRQLLFCWLEMPVPTRRSVGI